MTEKTEPDPVEEAPELTQEEALALINYRDASVVLQIANGLHNRWTWLLDQIAKGKQRNSKFNQGYLQSLRDTEEALISAAKPFLSQQQDEPVREDVEEGEDK